MSSWYDLYKIRLNASGTTEIERKINNQRNLINNSFKNSPNYQEIIKSDNTIIGARIERYSDNENGFDLRFLITEYNNTFYCGEVFTINGEKWLVIIKPDINNGLYNKAIIRQCNQVLTLQTGISKTQTGTDAMGRPIYSETPVYTSWDCIADNKISSSDLNESINLPEGKISVIIPYTDIPIIENMEFTMWDDNFKIVGINKTDTVNSTGIFAITAIKVVS